MNARCLLLLLAACAPYQSGEVFRLGEMGQMDGARRFECLDVQVTPSFSEGRAWVPIHYAFGNPCRRAVAVDLSAVRVGASHGGDETILRAYDPRGEIHAGELDARMRAEETIAYELPPSWVGKQLHVCVRLSSVAEAPEDSSSYCFDWSSN